MLVVTVPESVDERFVDLGEFLTKLLLGPECAGESCCTHAFQFLGKVLFVLLVFKVTELANNFLLKEMAREGRMKMIFKSQALIYHFLQHTLNTFVSFFLFKILTYVGYIVFLSNSGYYDSMFSKYFKQI